MFKNLACFLKAIIPVAEECGIKMAIHPDDPLFSVFGLPRIVTSKKNLDRIINLVDSPSNGLTLCCGSLGSNLENNIPEIIRYFGKKGRIHFGHVRNVQVHDPGIFNETAHKSNDGSFDMYEIMKAFYDIGFTGPIRPDHGRMIGGEEGRPGYGLFDRALGANYLCGLWDSINRIYGQKEGGFFGSDLYQIGLGEKIEGYFKEMLEEPHAVRNVLKKHIKS